MSSSEFWHGDPWLAAAYQKAEKIKIQRKSEEMWLQGLYNYKAVYTATHNALLPFFKGGKPEKYAEEPLRITPYTEEEKAALAEKERQKVIDYFNRLAKKHGDNVPSAG